MADPKMQEKMLPIKEAAERVGLKKGTLLGYGERGLIDLYQDKFSNRYFVPEEQLAKLNEQRLVRVERKPRERKETPVAPAAPAKVNPVTVGKK